MSEQENKKGFWGSTFTRLKSALVKTKEQVQGDSTEIGSPSLDAGQGMSTPQSAAPAEGMASQVKSVAPPKKVDQEYLEDLEDRLIKADLGLAAVDQIMEDLRSEYQGKEKSWTSHDVDVFLRKKFAAQLAKYRAPLQIYPDRLNVIMVVGVNGVGKTTSIGKLAHRYKQAGKKVLLAAGDTFRAAAESQLEIWADRAGVDIVRLKDGSDPGAVVWEALKKAKAENYEVLIIDTAGRLHNKTNLMQELKKVRGVVDKQAQNQNIECLLVLDASTGQNGLQQAKVFSEVCGLTGVILTKLDGTAKGGVVFAISQELQIPVKLIGLGEKMDDLKDFDDEMFVSALF